MGKVSQSFDAFIREKDLYNRRIHSSFYCYGFFVIDSLILYTQRKMMLLTYDVLQALLSK